MAQIPPAPSVRIFLRDDFQLRAKGSEHFREGVKRQLQFAKQGGIGLIAACSQRPFDLKADTAEPPPPMMHIWSMPQWQSLYDAMYASSENIWYEKLEDSIQRERQELLVELQIGYGTKAGFPPKSHVYLYQELRFNGFRVPNGFQRALNRFVAEVQQKNWTWRWCATQVTSQPQVLCMLWSAPNIAAFEHTLAEVRGNKEGAYETMMQHVASLAQRYLYPNAVEEWAAAGAKAPAAPAP